MSEVLFWTAVLVTMSMSVTGGVGVVKRAWMRRAGVPEPWLTKAFHARKDFDLRGLLERFSQSRMLRIDGLSRKSSHSSGSRGGACSSCSDAPTSPGVGFLGLSVSVDVVQDQIEAILGTWRILVEDGFKLLGIAGWFGYFLRCALGALSPDATS
jgi:hypothetical protein